MNELLLRESNYRGADSIEKLANFHLTIAGAGTLGSNLAETLTRQGISKLRLIDRDRVESQNLGPQIYSMDDIGAIKVDAARNRIFSNVEVEIEAVGKELTPQNIKRLLRKTDLVVDAFDNQRSRQCLFDFCAAERVECLHVGMFEGYGEVVWNQDYRVPDDSEQDLCDYPLARNLGILVCTVASEEIIDFVCAQQPRRKSWSITLSDLKINAY